MNGNQVPGSVEEVTIPPELDAASSKLVYLRLAVAGEASVTDLAETLDMRKLALYGVLGSLADRGFVERTGETYRTVD